MASISQLPVELLLSVFPSLNLKSLIAAHAVCRRWRELIFNSNISPSRRALLELYLEIVTSPHFPKTQTWALKKLKHFDREAYVVALLDQYDDLPEYFRTWILEWPARAAFGCVWPGLPCIEITDDMADGVQLMESINWLGSTPPRVSAMTWLRNGKRVPVPGLLIWSSCNGYTWLVLDKRKELCGKVFELESSLIWTLDGDDVDRGHRHWIDFLKELWGWIERAACEQASAPINNSDSSWYGGQPPRFPATRWVWKPEP